MKLGCIVMTLKLNKSAQTSLSSWPKKMCQIWCKTGNSSCFFNQEVVIHHECAAQNQIVHRQFYLELLGWLYDSVFHKWLPRKWQIGEWQIYHDDKLALTQSNHIPHVCQPPYSPDMALCDCFLFPKIKNTWRAVDLKMWKQSNLTQCSNLCRSPKQN